MKSKQLNFYITKEKEQELFRYIINECGCKIYQLYKRGEKVTFEIGDEINDSNYFIIRSDLIKEDIRYADSEEGMMLYPFDENANFYPFILYERHSLENSDNAIPYRLYRTENINMKNKMLLKSTYKTVSDWIIKNSVKSIRDGILKIYYVE